MKIRIATILTLIALTHGCADAEFAAGNGSQGVRQTPTPKPPPVIDPPVTNTGDQTGTSTDGNNKTACVRAPGAVSFDFSIATHKDSVTHYNNNMPKIDIEESPVMRFNVAAIVGDVLPVSDFALDDVAFIVKETDQFPVKTTRTISIPDHALMIKDGNNPRGANGMIDSSRDTVYMFKGQSRTITRNKQDLATALNNISGMGISPINHNQIKISEMRDKGFVDGNGDVAFKVIHVSHGHGYIRMKYTLQPCK